MDYRKDTFHVVGDCGSRLPPLEGGTPNVPVASVTGSGTYEVDTARQDATEVGVAEVDVAEVDVAEVVDTARQDARPNEGTLVPCLTVVGGRVVAVGGYDWGMVKRDLWIT